MLKGAKLVDFLEAQGSFRLEFSHLGENYFRVLSSRKNPEFNQGKIVSQLSLEFGTDESALSEIPNPHVKLELDLEPQKPVDKPLLKEKEKLQEKPKENMVTKPCQLLRDKSQNQLQTQTSTQHTSARTKRRNSAREDTLADRSKEVVPVKNVLQNKSKGETSEKNALKQKKKKEASKSIKSIKTIKSIEPKSDLAEKLFDAHGIPGQIIINHVVGKLKISAFTARFCRNQNIHFSGK